MLSFAFARPYSNIGPVLFTIAFGRRLEFSAWSLLLYERWGGRAVVFFTRLLYRLKARKSFRRLGRQAAGGGEFSGRISPDRSSNRRAYIVDVAGRFYSAASVWSVGNSAWDCFAKQPASISAKSNIVGRGVNFVCKLTVYERKRRLKVAEKVGNVSEPE